MTTHRTDLIKLLQANAYRHHMHDVFRDFVELATGQLELSGSAA